MNTSNTNAILDLLIIGAGPVGLTAALEAKRLGLSVRIIDRKTKRSIHDSRAVVVHPRVMELLESIQNGAVTKEIAKTAFQLEGVFFYLKKWFGWFKKKDGDSNDHVNLNLNNVIWGDTDYPNLYFLPQFETERILEGAFNADGGQVEYGVSLENLTQADNLVTTTLHNETDEATETVTSKWVLGADGGRSKTRDLVGIKINRLRSDLYLIVADVVFKGEPPLASHAPGKGGHVFPSKNGVVALLPLPGENSYRLVGQAAMGITSKDQVTLDEVFFEQYLLKTTGKKFEVELGPWQTIFEVTHGSSDSYRQENVMLAGDASHVHSPIGGQGMNLGMQDSSNLLWKLAWAKRVMEAASNEAEKSEAATTVETILGSYHSERHTLGQELIKSVEAATRLLASRNLFVQFIRNMFIRIFLPSDHAKNDFRKAGQLELAYTPESSPFIIEKTTKKNFIGIPGQRLPNIRLDDGSHLYSHIDRVRHTWVFLNTAGPSSKNSCSKFVVTVIPAKFDAQVSVPPISKKTFAAQQVLLVRPDQFVAGVGETQEELLKELKKAGMNEKALETM